MIRAALTATRRSQGIAVRILQNSTSLSSSVMTKPLNITDGFEAPSSLLTPTITKIQTRYVLALLSCCVPTVHLMYILTLFSFPLYVSSSFTLLLSPWYFLIIIHSRNMGIFESISLKYAEFTANTSQAAQTQQFDVLKTMMLTAPTFRLEHLYQFLKVSTLEKVL